MTDIQLPEGWTEHDFGECALYCQLVDGEPAVRFVRTSDYFGGAYMESVYRVTDGSTHKEFQELGECQEAANVLQDLINDFEDTETPDS